jgi:hypothetical protein
LAVGARWTRFAAGHRTIFPIFAEAITKKLGLRLGDLLREKRVLLYLQNVFADWLSSRGAQRVMDENWLGTRVLVNSTRSGLFDSRVLLLNGAPRRIHYRIIELASDVWDEEPHQLASAAHMSHR